MATFRDQEVPMAAEISETENNSTDGVEIATEEPASSNDEQDARGTWRHAAFHVATTIATPAAYAPLPFAVASLGWPLGVSSLVSGTLATWYSSLLIASLWRWDGKKHTTYRHLAKSIYGSWGYWSIAFFQQVASLGNNIAIQIAAGSSLKSTVRKPARKNMYKGVSAAYSIIVLTYWQLAFWGYWAFGSDVKPYIVASLTAPECAIVMANLFAVVQISGCFQIYCRPTYAHFEERMSSGKPISSLQEYIHRLFCTSIYTGLITLVASAMPFFGDFVSICGAVGFTPLDFVFPVLAYMKAGKMPRHRKLRLPVLVLNTAIAAWFSIVAVLGCVGAVRFIVRDTKTYRFFRDM